MLRKTQNNPIIPISANKPQYTLTVIFTFLLADETHFLYG